MLVQFKDEEKFLTNQYTNIYKKNETTLTIQLLNTSMLLVNQTMIHLEGKLQVG